MARDIYLKIEQIADYSPVEPQDKTAPPIQYLRDGMRNVGHMDGTIPGAERDARALTAVVYREYQDDQYLIPNTAKIVPADINEPIWDRRVPGTVLWATVGETLHIHVLNADNRPIRSTSTVLNSASTPTVRGPWEPAQPTADGQMRSAPVRRGPSSFA